MYIYNTSNNRNVAELNKEDNDFKTSWDDNMALGL